MHIAIDARELAGRKTGAGRYLDRLLIHWARLDTARRHAFGLYAHEAIPAPPAGLPATVTILPGGGGTRWEQMALAAALRRNRPDVLFAPAYTAPLMVTAPVVLTVHDVSFVAHPEWFRWREGWRRRVLTRAAARRARLVLTVSEFSQREIERCIGIPAERIRVVAHGVGMMEAPAGAVPGSSIQAWYSDERSNGRTGQPPRLEHPIVLFVGSILNRRHVPDLIEAVALAAQRVTPLRLVVAGENRSWPRQDLRAIADRLGVKDRVDVRAFVPEDELLRLYSEASVFVFLSEYEGFGLTPLEALAAGVPPVVLDTPVAREVYGTAARYVSSSDPSIVAEAIVELLTSEGARHELLANAPAVLARYRWSDAAASTLTAIEQAASQ
jgi:glycosyltransferase involved in cell wall biosynthesis